MHKNGHTKTYARTRSFFRKRVSRTVMTTMLLALMSACASNVTVKSNIPVPLVERLPLKVHLAYTDEFRNHVYQENEKRRALKSLNLAQAQIDMFDQVFGNLTTMVSADDPSRDLTIEPEILEFQYSAPSETKLKQYEIWIKYRLKILDQKNESLADWVVKGYGKTPTAMLTSASKAFNSATNVALRDTGAQLAINFKGQRKIKALIDQKNDTPSVAANALSAENLSPAPAAETINTEGGDNEE